MHTESHRSHNLNIPELVYKFLIAEAEAIRKYPKRVPLTRCCYCGHKKFRNKNGRIMSYRSHRDIGRVSKSRIIRRHPTSRDGPISYLQKCVGTEGTRKARKYIKRALNFGVDSGYLIPSDSTFKMIRVSSDLMKSDLQKGKPNTCDKILSKEHETPDKLDDLQMQEQRRRRRRGRRRRRRSRVRSRSPRRRRRSRRRRSRSRRRRRRRRSRSRSDHGSSRYNSSQNPEEVAEDDADDYEIDENDSKNNTQNDREPKTNRSKPDEEQSKKTEDSDLSVDEDESEDEERKKRANIAES